MSIGDEKGLKRFDCESDDAGKQLKKWKAWVREDGLDARLQLQTTGAMGLYPLRWESAGVS